MLYLTVHGSLFSNRICIGFGSGKENGIGIGLTYLLMLYVQACTDIKAERRKGLGYLAMLYIRTAF